MKNRRFFLQVLSAVSLMLLARRFGFQGFLRNTNNLRGGAREEEAEPMGNSQYTYASSVSDIHEKLDKIVETMRTVGFLVDDQFNPGLSRAEIAEKTKDLPFPIPEELYQLYTWRNGTRVDTNLFMFRDHFFIPLEQAIIELEETLVYYEMRNALPFAAFDGALLVLPSFPYQIDIEYPPQPPTGIALERPVIGVFEDVSIFAYSFSIMLDMVTDWLVQGAVEIGDELFDADAYQYRTDLEHRLWEKHNPGIFGTPEIVYVPGTGFQEVVTLTASSYTVHVNEPVVLSATRSTGPVMWRKLVDVPIGACWWSQSPPAYEDEVAANLGFEVTPRDLSRFDVSRRDWKREVTFLQPGSYQVRGHSAVWCLGGEWSNTIEINVLP